MLRMRIRIGCLATACLCLATCMIAPCARGQEDAIKAPISQTVIELNSAEAGDRFDGIGAVSGGGATSVLLKDYPEKQRGEILDLLFKPKFGASISALYVEVPGDGNSTQGAEPSHKHSQSDLNYFRGYEWWLMKQAKTRNPDLSLDACAWGCPGWVGNGSFWSQDMCDYYVSWVKGLRSSHGLILDAIGCRNEKGVDEDFPKILRKALDRAGLNTVKIHAFDNWGDSKWDWCKDLLSDPELARSIDVISNHTLTDVKAPDSVQKIAHSLHKPIWDTEEHVYKDGFDCEISIVQAFNANYIDSGATKIVNWYLVGSVYPNEPYPESPSMLIANSPWSGAYMVRPALWGYAHYGQFTEIGWRYMKGACANLQGGGSYVTLKSPTNDYSIILQTKGASAPQTLRFHVGPGLSTSNLCVWRSDAKALFVRLEDVKPDHGFFSITLEPNAIYSLSTTRGQRKGDYVSPKPAPFPFPYREDFSEYRNAREWGYLPHYFADIVGVFELANRPDGRGLCLRQVVDQKAQSWAPEWMPYTIFGDPNWSNYEVSANIYIEHGGFAGIMGRITSTGNGWENVPQGYYLSLANDGTVGLWASNGKHNSPGDRLASGLVPNFKSSVWHSLKLQFSGGHISGFVDTQEVVSAESTSYQHGTAGLLTGGLGDERDTALFDNVIVNGVGAPLPTPTPLPGDLRSLY